MNIFIIIVEAQSTNNNKNSNHLSLCIHRLAPAVGALYVRKFFNDNKAKSHAVSIVENIRDSFNKMLTEVTWMDDRTKKEAIAKANSLVTHIAYPNELINNTKLEEYYKTLELNEDEYLLNAMALNKFAIQHMLRDFHAPLNKTDWEAHAAPAMTNAFYSALENSIQFPAGILQGI